VRMEFREVHALLIGYVPDTVRETPLLIKDPSINRTMKKGTCDVNHKQKKG